MLHAIKAPLKSSQKLITATDSVLSAKSYVLQFHKHSRGTILFFLFILIRKKFDFVFK